MKWWVGYIERKLIRRCGRSLLSVILAAVLFFAFGELTSLRITYAELHRNVKIQAIFWGGLPYTTALKIADSGYVSEPYYEYVSKGCDAEFKSANIVFTNDLDGLVTSPIKWLDGWDEMRAMESNSKICIISSKHAEELGLSMGELIRVNEHDLMTRLCDEMGLTKEGEEDKLIAERDKRRPKLQIVGLIETDVMEPILYVPATAWRSFTWLFGNLELDQATYLLKEYDQVDEFAEYVNEVLSTVDNPVKMQLDTSEADRIYQIHRLIESLYPLTVIASIIIGSILPGLTVLHDSKDISILRALGVGKLKVLGLCISEQILLAFTGLLIGVCAILITAGVQQINIARTLGCYFAAYVVGVGFGSGICTWWVERKDVLALLQTRK